jgi:hypothetical protein
VADSALSREWLGEEWGQEGEVRGECSASWQKGVNWELGRRGE